MLHTGDIVAIAGRRFRLEDGIGQKDDGAEGGFGVVFAARELDAGGRPTGPDLALKLVNRRKLRQALANSGETEVNRNFVESFAREIEALRLFAGRPNRHIIGFVHAGTMAFPDEPGRSFPALVMERCDGTLAGLLRPEPDQPARAAALKTRPGLIRLLDHLAQALDALGSIRHDGGQLIHRDVKPANILYRGDRYILSDFGSVKYLRGWTVSLGAHTPEYVAPELWPAIAAWKQGDLQSVPVMPSGADIYGVGLVAYRVLTGREPFGQQEKLVPPGGLILNAVERQALRQAVDALPETDHARDGDTVLPSRVAASDLTGLIEAMLSVDPAARPKPADIRRRLAESTPPRLTPINISKPPLRLSVAPPSQSWRLPALGAATLACLGIWAASAAPVTHLESTAPTRWTGRSTDYPAPLCDTASGPGLVAGERLVVDATLRQPWWRGAGDLAAEWRGKAGGARAGLCRPAGAAWQCVIETAGLAGTGEVHLTEAGTGAAVTLPAAIAPACHHAPARLSQGLAIR